MKICALIALLVASSAILSAQGADSQPASKSGVDLSAIDKSVDPCVDFYQYACGNWIKNNPIPKEESRWGRFSELHERNQKILREIAEDSAAHTNRSATDQKVGDFYGSCMAEDHIDELGSKPLEDELKRIQAISTPKDFVEEIARLHARQVNVFFQFGAEPDPDNAKIEMAGLDQGGLGLPEKDYYFRTDPDSVELRKKYVAHIAKMLELAGTPASQAQSQAESIMKIETDLAKGSMDVVQRRDPKSLVHKYKTTQLGQVTPSFALSQYFTDLDSPSFSEINIAAPDFMKTMDKVIDEYKLDGLKPYLRWHYIHSSAVALPKAFVDENFNFYGHTLTGAQQLRPRWKRCISMTDGELGEAIGKEYVEKTFGAEGKARTLEMVDQIEAEMAKDIQSLSWMTPETKKQALIKLHGVTNKIGYPDKWRDYTPLDIVKGEYLGNMYRANQFDTKRDRNKIGKPVDKAEWDMTPPTVNAYYDPTQNNINFPAGILQPPFYSNKADDAVNFGAVGAVIGHELTHGFDDEGRQFDANGNLRDWWQPKDEERFKKLAECVEEEYSSFEPIPGVHIRGKLTLGENTADNGGLRLAYAALFDTLAKHSLPANTQADGYSTNQRFFVSWGQIWCESERPESERLLLQTNPHSPAKYRVNGVVKNMEQFSSAFSCKPDQSMFAAPGKACRVW